MPRRNWSLSEKVSGGRGSCRAASKGCALNKARKRIALICLSTHALTFAPGSLDPAFTLEKHDRFHRILISDPVRYDVQPDAETILTFFVIRRALGTYDIFNVLKTFVKGKVVSRNVQNKPGIAAKDIDAEMANVTTHFSKGVKEGTGGYELRWHVLDLSDTNDRDEQVARIKAWGRVAVFKGDVELG